MEGLDNNIYVDGDSSSMSSLFETTPAATDQGKTGTIAVTEGDNAVVFDTPFTSNNYVVFLSDPDGVGATSGTLLSSGFTISANGSGTVGYRCELIND